MCQYKGGLAYIVDQQQERTCLKIEVAVVEVGESVVAGNVVRQLGVPYHSSFVLENQVYSQQKNY